MNFAGVIFDMDGVLCDSEDFMAEAATAMFAEAHGVTVLPEEFRPFRGMGEDPYYVKTRMLQCDSVWCAT